MVAERRSPDTGELEGETYELEVSGNIAMSGWLQPKQWAVQAQGKIAGQLLLVLAPEVFSSASGSATLNSLWLTGKGTDSQRRGLHYV